MSLKAKVKSPHRSAPTMGALLMLAAGYRLPDFLIGNYFSVLILS
jgi:hypothetical protein